MPTLTDAQNFLALTNGGTVSTKNIDTVDYDFVNAPSTVNGVVSWVGQTNFTIPSFVFSIPAGDTTGTAIDFFTLSRTGLQGTTVHGTIVNFDLDVNGGFQNILIQAIPAGGTTPVTYMIDKASLQSQPTFPITDFQCFVEGTRIRTERGEIAVEDLVAGDTVHVQDESGVTMRPVVWIGHRSVDLNAIPDPYLAQPIRIHRDAFGDGMPCRDLLVSPDHAIFVDGGLIPARLLINGASIVRDTLLSRFRYFHVELDRHSVVLSENLPTESYLDTGNRSAFDNGGPVVDLVPDFWTIRPSVTRDTHSCAPFVYAADDVSPVWERLAARAGQRGFRVPAIETTADPMLRLSVDGRLFRPVCAIDGVYSFMLPSRAAEVRLLSRSARPCDTRPWIEDRRMLGVYVTDLRVRHGLEITGLPLDGPAPCRGWWDVERDAGRMARWTTGDALLHLPEGRTTTRVLELTIGGGMSYPVREIPATIAPLAQSA